MPTWIDLSEHKAALNVYQSTEGKVLILRALSSDHSIPDSIVQLGFEKRDEHFVRDNLRFSLKEIQNHFPLAKSRDFASTEIFYVPPAPVVTAPTQTSTKGADKAPWQMVAEEWYRARQALQVTAKVTANSEFVRIGKIEELSYGVTKWRHERALAGDKEALERLDEPVSHLEVVKKAISEGKQIPFDVVTEYPELLEAADDEHTQIPDPTDRQDQDQDPDPVAQLQLSTVEIKSARKRPGTERLIRSPEVQRFGRHGFVAEYFVAFIDDRYPMVVEALDRDQAIEFARRERAALERRAPPKTHDLTPARSPARYPDGRTVPIASNTVFDYRGGLGGSPVLVRGEVIKRGEVLRVNISGTFGMFIESSKNASETLTEGWTIEGEEHPYQRKMREAKERSEQYEHDRAAEREDVGAQVQASKDSGHRHLDDTQPPAGTSVEDIISGGRATVVRYEDFGAGPEPLLRFDGQDAERTSGNAQFRSRYRIVATGKQLWNVPLQRFLVDARHERSESGAYQVVFGDLKIQVDEKNADKALRAVHKDQVRAAYAAGKHVGFAVMADYPEISYGAGERAASNVSKLISQLGAAEKLMDGEMQYLKLVNGSYTDLIIERLPDPDGESLYLTHYLESNGDRFIDSEMVFSIAPDGRLVLSETAIQHPVRGGELRGRDTSFANMFSKNLLDQSFAKAKIVWHDDEHDVEQTDAATLEKGIELIQDVATELGGTFSDWEHSDKSVLGQWRYSNLSIGEAVVRIGVSEGGVVQVNGDPFTPEDRVMNITRDAVLTSVKAALPQVIGHDLEKAIHVMQETARANMPTGFKENVTSDRILQIEAPAGDYKVRFSIISNSHQTKVAADVLQLADSGAAAVVSSAHIPVHLGDIATATLAAMEDARTYLDRVISTSETAPVTTAPNTQDDGRDLLARIMALADEELKQLTTIMGTPEYKHKNWRSFTEIDIHSKNNADIVAGLEKLAGIQKNAVPADDDISAAVSAARLPATAPQRIPLYGISVEYEAQRYCLPSDFYEETTQNGYAFFAPATKYRTPEFTTAESSMYDAHRLSNKEAVKHHRAVMGEEMRKMVRQAREAMPEAELVAAVLRIGDQVRFTPDPEKTLKNRIIEGTIVSPVHSSSGSPGFEVKEAFPDAPLLRVWATEGRFSLLAHRSDEDAFSFAREAAMQSYDNPHRIEALIREMLGAKGQTMVGAWAERFTFNVAVPATLQDLVVLMEKHFPSLLEIRAALDIDKIADRDIPNADYGALAEKQQAAIRAFRASFSRTTQAKIHDIRSLAPDSDAAFQALESYAQGLDEAEQALGRYEQKYAAQQEAANQAKWEKFEPYRAGSIRKPPAAKIGFTKAWLAEKNSWFQVRNGGAAAWSNGHLFDVGVPHYSGFEKYHSARYSGMPIEQRPDINRYMTLQTTEKIKPIFVQREIAKDRDAVLLARENGQVVGIDKVYFDYIVSKHPSAGFFIVADWVPNGGSTDAIVHAKVDDQVVAGVMPARGTDEYTVALIQEKIELYNPQSQLDADDDAPDDGIEVLKWDFVSKQRAGGRAAATAMIKVAQIDGRWFSSIDTSHNQGSHAGRGEPLTSHGPGFESMFDARFDAGNRIVLEQRQIAGRSYDSMTTDKQRAAAREMVDWALKTILPQYQLTDIQSGPYERWKRVSVTEGPYQGQMGIGSNEQDAIENLRDRLELIVSGDRYLWRSIGVNRENLAIEEDPAGVRAVIRNGVRVTERVSITPHGPRLDLDKRDLDYLTIAELEAIRKEEAALPVTAGATSTPQATDQVKSAPHVGDVLGGETVNALVDDIPVSFRRKKVSQYDTRKDIVGKSCTWASAYINDEWRSLGEPWPHARPSNAELAIAINHVKANPEHFDSDELLNEITRDIEAENADIPEERMRIEVVSADVFKVSKIGDESFELRFKDPAQPFSVLIEYQSPGVYMPERRSGGTGPRTSLRNALAWSARELNTSKAYYERSLVEQGRDMPRLEVEVESFRKLFGELRDNAATVQCLREKFPDPVPDTEVSVFGRPDQLKIPENLVLEWIDDRTINVSIADPDHHFDIQIRGMDGSDDAQKRSRWIATGALSRAIGSIEEELNWARAKADRPDAGAGLDELAQRQAEFMRAHDPERHNGVVSKMHRAFALALTDKDFNFLIGWIARPKGQNDLSKKYFMQVTGVKLPRNACDIKTALYEWAGYRPEDAERMESELRERRDAAFQKQEAERRIREATNTLEHTLVRHNGVEKSTRQFIDDIINAGYDSLETRKVGAVDRYRLVNKTDSTLYQIKGNMVDYARYVLSLRQEVRPIQEEDCTPSLKP